MGRTIAIDVEPDYEYSGGYGRKTFLELNSLRNVNVSNKIYNY